MCTRMNTLKYIHIHTCIHKHMSTYMHARTSTHADICLLHDMLTPHKCIREDMHACIHLYISASIHHIKPDNITLYSATIPHTKQQHISSHLTTLYYIPTCIHKLHVYIELHTYIQTYTHTYTYVHTYIRAPMHAYITYKRTYTH